MSSYNWPPLPSGGGGGGTPVGPDFSVQFRNGSNFDGVAGLITDTAGNLTANTIDLNSSTAGVAHVTTNTTSLYLAGGSSLGALVIKGGTAYNTSSLTTLLEPDYNFGTNSNLVFCGINEAPIPVLTHNAQLTILTDITPLSSITPILSAFQILSSNVGATTFSIQSQPVGVSNFFDISTSAHLQDILVINSAGSMGLGTAAPVSFMEISHSDSNSFPTILSITNAKIGTNSGAAVDFRTTDPAHSGLIYSRLLGSANGATGGLLTFYTQNSVGTLVSGMVINATQVVSILSTLRVGNGSSFTNAGIAINASHLVFQQATPPTIAAGAPAGTGAVVSLTNPTDQCGLITITTGTGPTTGTACTLTFNKAFSHNVCVIIGAQNSAAALLGGAWGQGTTASFGIHWGIVPAASTTYTYFYQIMDGGS